MTWQLLTGDCVEVMAGMAEASVDAVVTDPPYGLHFMGKTWDEFGGPLGRQHTGNGGSSDTGGAMKAGKYDLRPSGLQGFQAEAYRWGVEMIRVLKPGGHLLSFGGTRTYHRLACALEDAGFEIRDCLAYLYGAGFPKSLNLDRLGLFCRCGEGGLQHGESPSEHDMSSLLGADVSEAEGAAGGQGSLLLAGVSEPGASTARRSELPASEVRAGQPGVEGRSDAEAGEGQLPRGAVRPSPSVGVANGPEGRLRHGAPTGDRQARSADADSNGSREPRRSQSSQQRPGEPRTLADEPGPQARGVWPLCPRCSQPLVPRGLGTALKPAFEPIVLARKPLIGTVAENVLEHGTGALNVDGTRIEGPDGNGVWGTSNATTEPDRTFNRSPGRADYRSEKHASGRWPANVVLDAEAAALLDEQTGERGGGFGRRGAIENAGAPQGGPRHGSRGRLRRLRRSLPLLLHRQDHPRAERELGIREYLPDKDEAPLNWSSGEQSPGTFQAEGTHRAARNHHPTVKPVDLMQWLCRLVTPPGGLVLDPFTGSGSTGIAALREGFSFVGIEREPEYVEIARARIVGDAPLFNTEEVVAENTSP